METEDRQGDGGQRAPMETETRPRGGRPVSAWPGQRLGLRGCLERLRWKGSVVSLCRPVCLHSGSSLRAPGLTQLHCPTDPAGPPALATLDGLPK